jgi:hypothetical protein
MKRLPLVIIGLLLMILILGVACTPKAPAPEAQPVSFCVTCHSDQALLKQTAAPVVVTASAANSGEG